jgi:serine/threonine protein kinase
MDFSVQNICGFLIRGRLRTAEEVKQLSHKWQHETTEVGNVNKFVKWLVNSKHVTEYQASLLVKGQVDDFFLNEYQILERLGRGRMAGVYKAMHPLGQMVAIKVLPPSRAKNSRYLGRFQREARLARKLKHPNVVRTFQIGESRGVHYLVMEFIDGETLDEILQRRKILPPTEAVRIIHQALLGLHYIHEQGMVHRDLKPSNLMLTPPPGKDENDTTLKSTVKILDIGLARELFDESNPPPSEYHPNLTSEGVLLGTPDYLAPEQARDPRDIDIRADIYSLGCVLYHCLTGQPPFPDTNLLSQLVRHATEQARPLKEFNPAIPDGLQQIVNWMMAKEPADRYATPDRAAQALQVFLVADSGPVRPVSEDANLRNYLTWLERGEAGDAKGAARADTSRPAAAIPAAPAKAAPAAGIAVPVGKPAAAAAARPAQDTASSPREKRAKQPSRSDAVNPPLMSTPAAADTGFDVELVPVAAPPLGARQGFVLTGRDWLFLGIGAFSVILAGLFGMGLAWLFR